jgi:hypothetical protein
VFKKVGWHKGVDLSPYPKGPDGKSIRCTVVEATPKLPDYYLSKIIYWICEPTDDFPAVDIRYEQYDPEGNLWKIYTRYWEYMDTYSPYTDHKPYYVNGGTGRYARGWRRCWHTQECVHDIQIDHHSYLYFYFWMVPYEKKDAVIKESWLTPEYATTEEDVTPEEFKAIMKKFPLYDALRPLLPERPPLWPDKFPETRKINADHLKRPWNQATLAREREIRAKYAQ